MEEQESDRIWFYLVRNRCPTEEQPRARVARRGRFLSYSNRDADNQMRVYCRFPETLTSFRTALGLYNRAIQKPPGIDVEALDQFRGEVARELDLPKPVGSNKDIAWIESLAGATSEPKTTQ